MVVLYIIQSRKILEKFYLGISERESERLEEHNRGQTKTTAPFVPWMNIYAELFVSRAEAMKRERYLKSIEGYKERKTIIEKYRKW